MSELISLSLVTMIGGVCYVLFKRKCITAVAGVNVKKDSYKRPIIKNQQMRQPTKLEESSRQHITKLWTIFFPCDGLAEAEEPRHIPMFPLSSTSVVYVMSRPDTLDIEISSVLARPKNLEVP